MPINTVWLTNEWLAPQTGEFHEWPCGLVDRTWRFEWMCMDLRLVAPLIVWSQCFQSQFFWWVKWSFLCKFQVYIYTEDFILFRPFSFSFLEVGKYHCNKPALRIWFCFQNYLILRNMAKRIICPFSVILDLPRTIQ